MSTAIEEFSMSLGRVRSLAESIRAETDLDPHLLALRETQQCGAVVLLSGYLEAFLKASIKLFIEQLSCSGVSFKALPQSIQKTHYQGGAEILKKIGAGPNPRFKGLSREDLVARLNSVSGISYQIVWEAFADTGSNPSPEQVKAMVKSIGIQFTKEVGFWDKIHAESGAGPNFTGSTLEFKLADLVGKRNECAHTGVVYPVPTASDIIEYIEVLLAIGSGLTAILQNELALWKRRQSSS